MQHIFNIPGLRNSGPQHWQSYWERLHPEDCQRIIQDDWAAPECQAWTARVEEVLQAHDSQQLLLTGHSVGCATIVNWHRRYRRPLAGALLVAPSDVEHPGYPSYIRGFAPLFLENLPFPSIVVASDDDPVVSLERARYFARCWGSELVVLSTAGHIEEEPRFGPWEEGWELLRRLEKMSSQ